MEFNLLWLSALIADVVLIVIFGIKFLKKAQLGPRDVFGRKKIKIHHHEARRLRFAIAFAPWLFDMNFLMSNTWIGCVGSLLFAITFYFYQKWFWVAGLAIIGAMYALECWIYLGQKP
jgi:hypothetical protein